MSADAGEIVVCNAFFPIVDIFFRSGDIRDRSAKSSEIAPKSMFFGPQFLDLVFKIAPIFDHVAKFRGDRPRDRGDLALNKKETRKSCTGQVLPSAKYRPTRVVVDAA